MGFATPSLFYVVGFTSLSSYLFEYESESYHLLFESESFSQRLYGCTLQRLTVSVRYFSFWMMIVPLLCTLLTAKGPSHVRASLGTISGLLKGDLITFMVNMLYSFIVFSFITVINTFLLAFYNKEFPSKLTPIVCCTSYIQYSILFYTCFKNYTYLSTTIFLCFLVCFG